MGNAATFSEEREGRNLMCINDPVCVLLFFIYNSIITLQLKYMTLIFQKNETKVRYAGALSVTQLKVAGLAVEPSTFLLAESSQYMDFGPTEWHALETS